MSKKTAQDFSTELGFTRYQELFAALNEFLSHFGLSEAAFATIGDDELGDVAAKFVKRHGYNYWSCERYSPSYPRDAYFIKHRIRCVLLLLRQQHTSNIRIDRAHPFQQELTRAKEGDIKRFERHGDNSVIPRDWNNSFRASSYNLRGSSPLNPLASKLSSLLPCPDTQSYCFLTLRVGARLATLSMNPISTPTDITEPRKRKYDTAWHDIEASNQKYAGTPESVGETPSRAKSRRLFQPESPPLRIPTASPPLTPKIGRVSKSQIGSPQLSTTTGKTTSQASEVSSDHNGVAKRMDSNLETNNEDAPMLLFEHNLTDYSIGSDEMQYFFFWFLDVLEMERIRLRKQVREATHEHDMLSASGSLEYLKRFDSKFVAELKLRGATKHGES